MTPGEDQTPFGALLRGLRLRAGLSQNRLARLGGIDPAYVNRLEGPVRGQWRPSRAVVLRLWDALEAAPVDRERLLVAAGHCPTFLMDLSSDRVGALACLLAIE